MTRRELREEIFKLLFMVEFYSKEEMAEQVKSYFEDFPENHNGTFRLLQLAIRKVAVYHVDSDHRHRPYG